MKRWVWRLLRRMGWAGWVAAKLPTSFLRTSGWLRSYDALRAVDAQGEALPWFTYAAIYFLQQRVQPQHKVFEWGAGQSSSWFAQRTGLVVSVDHDPAWVAQVQAHAQPNQRLLLATDETAYTAAYADQKLSFDIVVIDGIHRVACCAVATRHLSTEGVIVFDNSERPEYAEGLALLQQQGFRRIDFTGLAPASLLGTTTTIFYRSHNCLGI